MSRILEDNSTESWTYTYDANGMRLSRSSGTDADDVTYTYVYTDGLLTRMTIGDMMLYFTYDAADTPMTMSIHTGSNCAIGSETGCGADCATYYYVTNLQGDVIAILDDSGTAITLYQYDAWGYPTLTLDVSDDDIGTINPLRYRGYVYDHETKLYYLQSRYYNPEIGRFISADSQINPHDGLLGINLFAYCGNNPVNRFDSTGHSWESFWNGVGDWFEDHWVEVAVGTAFIVGGAVVTALTCGAGTTAWAAFGSALLSSAIQTSASVAVGVGVNGLVNVVNGKNFFDNVGDTIASSYMWGGILSGSSQILSGSFRFLRAKTGFKGLDTSKIGFFSADKLYYKRPGMTILRIGNRNGIRVAADLGKFGIHGHLFSSRHIPLIPVITGIIEIFN